MDSGSLAWIMICTALVLFMTPGLALFYGGLTRTKSTLNMMMMSLWCILVVPLVWVVLGYTLAFRSAGPFIGDLSAVGLRGISPFENVGVPEMAFVAFLATFAAITPALISGAVADRMKFSAWAIFVPVWSLLVYVPVTYWVANPEGWLKVRGSLDFAGGTSIHVNAGIAALVAAVMLGKRKGWPSDGFLPHSMPLVLIGTAILWLGWFGFNAGSAGAADGHALAALMATFVGSSAGGLGWVLTERVRDGAFTTLGACSGVVAGLVAITPACAYVDPMGAIAIGLIAGVVCSQAVSLKRRFGYDDSLDVVGVHFVGGLVGSLLIGLLSNPGATGWEEGRGPGLVQPGLLFGGGLGLLGEQLLANAVTIVFSGVVTAGILYALSVTIGLRVDEETEAEGLDRAEHAETAYHQAGLTVGARS